jgi:hypothetical protein
MTTTYTTMWVMNRRSFTEGTAALPVLGLPTLTRSAFAQAKYPTKPPRLVLPFAAGGLATSLRGSSLRSWAIGSDSASW